ncbi:Cell surface mannoprotein mp65 [Neocucurbitaria cava]|uniref:Cell surface mannoprotein mp65 n=1 Tax=Neocucurbitaria cava TaxID=798079 RepID=A0A9W8Y2I6_9PLEO|nr:Cell surface mannoprotein mp65 [Neocucurbitaria cava]
MKCAVLASALAAGIFLGTASGRPLNVKRALVTEVVYVTNTVADVVVYVDETGAPYSTTTVGMTSSVATPIAIPSTTSETAQPTFESSEAPQAPSSLAPAPASSPVAPQIPSFALVSVQAQATSVEVKADTPTISSSATLPPPAAATSEEPAQPIQASAAAQPSTAAPDAPAKESSDSLSLGITYDPFTGSQDNSQCKTEDEIASEFSKMTDYKIVRIYGMGCNIIPLAVQNVIKNGQKLMAGAYLSTTGDGEDLSKVIQTLKDAVDQYAGGNWDVIQLFSVENEQVNGHAMTASAVVDAINRGRSQLRGLGYNGPVGAVETVPATIDNPAICEASDVVMVNCHAFFDPNTQAQDAGTFVQSQIANVKSACNGKRVVVTESGWPHQGNSNGKAVASLDNQQKALDSIRANFDHDLFMYNAFDDAWKADSASTFNAERYWGVIQ